MKKYRVGDVGVGTTSPLAKLHLSGGVGQTIFANATIALGYATTGQYPHFIHTRHSNGNPTLNAIDFYTSDGTAAGVYPTNAVLGLTIANGNVGIGTSNPMSLVDINQKLTVLIGGNVGINSTSPLAKLQVNGTVASTVVSSSSLTVDFTQGNFFTDSVAAGTLVLNNMVDGTTYTLILTNSAGGTYTLSSTTVSTWRCSPLCASNQVTVSSGNHSILSITKVGTTAYVFWNNSL